MRSCPWLVARISLPLSCSLVACQTSGPRPPAAATLNNSDAAAVSEEHPSDSALPAAAATTTAHNEAVSEMPAATNDASTAHPQATNPGAPANPEATSDAARNGTSETPPPPPRFMLGPLSDDEVKDATYQALAATTTGPKNLGNGETEVTELGDITGFRFNIVKLLRGRDDVSGDSALADGMDVEVTGWYKRTVNRDGGAPACMSFDASVPISKQGELWRLRPGETAAFGREDSEDCF